jgi:predicted RNA-binding Zn-ribbon protein involved in translation (DUF1610 family)
MNDLPLNPYERYNITLPDEPPASIYSCDICGERFYIGDKFYKFDDTYVCEDCLYDFISDCIYEVTDSDIEDGLSEM